MLSVAWLNEDVRGLSITLESGEVSQASIENISAGKYPFVRDLNVVVRGDIKPSAQRFIDYLLGPEGQKKVEQSGYIGIAN